jgi:hypothetical protein
MIPLYWVFGENRVLSASIASHRLPRPKKPGQRGTSRPGIERTAPKRLDDATGLASVGCLPCGFGPDGAPALSLHRRAGRIAACIYDPEFRHQRNLSHRDPWQQHRRKLRDSGHDRNRGLSQYFDSYLDAISGGAANGAHFLEAIVPSPYGPRLWLSIRHSEGCWQLRDSIVFTL